jgi:hypothetical protein
MAVRRRRAGARIGLAAHGAAAVLRPVRRRSGRGSGGGDCKLPHAVVLWVAAQRGFAVASYEDAALGIMSKDERGREWVTKTTLRPVIRFDGDKRPSESELAALHHEAHDVCYIANSAKTEIVVEGRGEGLR